MRWLLPVLFCNFAVASSSASPPPLYADAFAVEPQVCVELRELQEGQVSGITSYNDVLAVATSSHVHLFSVAPPGSAAQKCALTESFKLRNGVAKFMEMKLLNATTFVYCEADECVVCRREAKDRWPCRGLHVQAQTRAGAEIEYAAAAFVDEAKGEIALRVAFAKGRAGIMVFGVDGLLNDDFDRPSAKAFDASFLEEARVVGAYSTSRHVFFVSSTRQPFEPYVNAKLATGQDAKQVIVKLSRVCSADSTPQLESRIDISLTCDGVDIDSLREVGAATFDHRTSRLYVLFTHTRRGGATPTDDVICSYRQKELEQLLDNTWSICQNTTYNEAVGRCEYVDDASSIPEHCYVFTRMADASRMLACSRFGADFDVPPYDNCQLHTYTSTAYRFGWLENYKAVKGVLVSRIRIATWRPTMMKLDLASDSFFFASENMELMRIAGDMDGLQTPAFQTPSFVSPFLEPTRFPLAQLATDGFFFVFLHRVLYAPLSCSSLFGSCESLVAGGFGDALRCAFCPSPSGGRVVAVSDIDRAVCRHPLRTTCPPVLEAAYPKQDAQGKWMIFGRSLGKLQKARALVCNETCTVAPRDVKDNMMTCTIEAAGRAVSSDCEVRLVGTLETQADYVVEQRRSGVDVAIQTDAVNSGGGNTPAWKVLIAVVSVILILGLLAVIIFVVRRHFAERAAKNADASLDIQFDTLNRPPTNRGRNSYTGSDPSGFSLSAPSMAGGGFYEKLFHGIDDALKIPLHELKFYEGDSIGSGHFGVVRRAVHRPEDRPEREVACKQLIADHGVTEFISEGLVMSNFNHPHVMSLVGISLHFELHFFRPIIVTDYMDNGDLARYLRSDANRPTLRHLLKFAIEIAEGMKYLHEQRFIHRDLAARNCMLDANLHIKVADFGLCRSVVDKEYSPLHTRDLPLRWMAPEALEEKFTLEGDVWSYGVVLWEIMTRGMLPYQSLQSYELPNFLMDGKRLHQPDYCPAQLYDVMLDCWSFSPEDRPAFADLPDRVRNVITDLERSYAHQEQLSSPYEQCNSARHSRSATVSANGGIPAIASVNLTELQSVTG